MQLTPVQAQRVFVPLVALTISGLMSLALTTLRVGLVAQLPALWLQQWAIAFAVALPTALTVVPALKAALARITVVHGSAP